MMLSSQLLSFHWTSTHAIHSSSILSILNHEWFTSSILLSARHKFPSTFPATWLIICQEPEKRSASVSSHCTQPQTLKLWAREWKDLKNHQNCWKITVIWQIWQWFEIRNMIPYIFYIYIYIPYDSMSKMREQDLWGWTRNVWTQEWSAQAGESWLSRSSSSSTSEAKNEGAAMCCGICGNAPAAVSTSAIEVQSECRMTDSRDFPHSHFYILQWAEASGV